MTRATLKYTSLTIPLVLIFLFIFFSAERPPKFDNQTWLKQLRNAELSTVLLNNSQGFVPVVDLKENKIAAMSFESNFSSDFDSILNKYTQVDKISTAKFDYTTSLTKLPSLNTYKTIIFSLPEIKATNKTLVKGIADLAKIKKVIVVYYGKTTGLKYLDELECPIILSPENTSVSASFIAQLIFGGTEAKGKLGESISLKFKKGDGYETRSIRLKYTVPEEVGISRPLIEQPVDKIMAEALSQKATPGAVVMVVKDGRVIFNKAYGFHTYKSRQWDRVDDIFDLASVTKISATTIAAMRLLEQNKINLNEQFGNYFPAAQATSKSNITLRELMLHEAGLIPYIPFFKDLKPGDYGKDSSDVFSVKVADHYYLKTNYYQDVMLPRMLKSNLSGRGKYEYSDLSMYFMKEVIEKQVNQPLNEYVLKEFYQPLGMKTAGYNPRSRFNKSRIIPTEQDLTFRKTLLEGYVHDQGAAMAGGVAGHAGVFATSNDLAILFQMILNKGTYGGVQYLKPETIALFTSRQSLTSRRGLGFDRWDPETGTYPSTLASDQTFGHTGYTGTCVLIDPKYNLIYIFLSNRVHPQVSDKLSTLKIRPRIQDAVYEAIKKSGI